jgi:hypothetical protein
MKNRANRSQARKQGVASPVSTGSGGPFFEQHVDAYWLALLLMQGVPPVFRHTTVTEVTFQTERLGWATDDFLVLARSGSGDTHRLAGSVKKTLTVSANDDAFYGAIRDAWIDFTREGLFQIGRDAFLIATQVGTNALLRHFVGLLDCARASSDAADFNDRLTTPGVVHAELRTYLSTTQSIVSEAAGATVPVDELWRFLREVYLVSLDLNTPTAQMEAHVKTLLAHTATETDRIGAADATWNALVTEVSGAMPQAKRYRRSDLPKELLHRHGGMSAKDHATLTAVAEHSSLVTGTVRSTVGNEIQLPRTSVLAEVLEAVEDARIVLVAGAAGSGKSAVATTAVQILGAEQYVFAFRAEEFTYPTLDAALTAAQIPARAAELSALTAAQPRKILLVESVERLLEASTRDAFTDLLKLVKDDQTWRLILTCRDYSVGLVDEAFLRPSVGAYRKVHVPQLTDPELAIVEARYPAIGRLLHNDRLRALLRNPYTLDIATRIEWPVEGELPRTEREFRSAFFRYFVRADHRRENGLPQRRADSFMELSARRARALALFASVRGLDAAAIDALENDGLIVRAPEQRSLAAPTHDVLEDWGVLEWIEEQFLASSGVPTDFASRIGSAPAIRRTYRTWIAEFLERDVAQADTFFNSVISDDDIADFFRDDTILAFLKSDHAGEMLRRYAPRLVADDRRLLQRMIHLLRVGCVRLPDWLAAADVTSTPSSILLKPDGAAWPAILRLVAENLNAFGNEDRGLLLGLIKDWTKGVEWKPPPYQEGHEAAAAIADWLMPAEQAMHVLVQIPASAPDVVAAWLRGQKGGEFGRRVTDDFLQLVFDGTEGSAIARDLPDLLIEVGRAYLLATEAELDDDDLYGWHGIGIDLDFGIKHEHEHRFFPPSAYRGPFWQLLRHHWWKGFAFVLDLFNHSADWYANPRVQSRLESPEDLTLTFADGTTKRQWCNGRLWGLYRGASASPNVLQTAAMAFERVLFDIAAVKIELLEPILLRLLRESDSAALTAIVASLATAYPQACGEALLVLLSNPMCIRIDRSRMAAEMGISMLTSRIWRRTTFDEVYAAERKEADARPHRREDLEAAITKLQLTPFRDRVYAAIDTYRANLPPAESQSEEDRLWRLALHRMDLRGYSVTEPTEEMREALRANDPTPSDDSAPVDDANYLVLQAPAADADLQEWVSSSQEEYAKVSARLGLQMWGIKVFAGEEPTKYDPSRWRENLTVAMEGDGPAAETTDHPLFSFEFGDGAGFVAAICIRDHWDDLTKSERVWCVRRVCANVRRGADRWNEHAVAHGFDSAGASAGVLPLLLIRMPTNTRIRRAFADALLHASDDVRLTAARAAARYFWPQHPDLALRSARAFALEAATIQAALSADDSHSGRRRRDVDRLHAEAAKHARAYVLAPESEREDSLVVFDADDWYGAEASRYIATILIGSADDAITTQFFQRIARTLVTAFDAQDQSHGRASHRHETDDALEELTVEFLFRVSSKEMAATTVASLLEAIDRHPDELRYFMHDLIIREDQTPTTDRFWFLWKLVSGRVLRASWLPHLDSRNHRAGPLMGEVLLSVGWKDGARDWRALHGHVDELHAFFEALPVSKTALHYYIRFLYCIGEQSLPAAYVRIADKLRSTDDPRVLLDDGEIVFLLESILQRQVYAKPVELKRRDDLRAAILYLLDRLVDAGSSAAFRMRDDFVTPLQLKPESDG